MSLYLIKLFSTINADGGNPCVNAFTYVSTSLAPGNLEAVEIADAFYQLFFVDNDDLANLMASNVNYYLIEVTAPANPIVLATQVIDIDGIAAGEQTANFVALEWYSARTRTDIRSGFKRFGPTSELLVFGNGIQGDAIIRAPLLSAELSTTLEVSVGGLPQFVVPAIVKRIKYVAPSGKDAYRLPNATDPLDYSVADNWVWVRTTTQSSRKR